MHDHRLNALFLSSNAEMLIMGGIQMGADSILESWKQRQSEPIGRSFACAMGPASVFLSVSV